MKYLLPTINNNSNNTPVTDVNNTPVTDVNNVTAIATVTQINENTTSQENTTVTETETIAPASVNNEFTLHNTVSIEVIKALDPGYEKNIL